MASSYALPPEQGKNHRHAHSHSHAASHKHSGTPASQLYNHGHSFSDVSLAPPSTSSPGEAGHHFRVGGHAGPGSSSSNGYAGSSHLQHSRSGSNNSNGSAGGRGSFNNGLLYTHNETSKDTTPIPSPSPPRHNHSHDDHHHPHTNSFPFPSTLNMKSRPRGESDLGRPAQTYHSQHSDGPAAASASLFSLPQDMVACVLLPLPYLLAAAAFQPIEVGQHANGQPRSALEKLQKAVLENDDESLTRSPSDNSSQSRFVQACILTAGTLLLVGALAKIGITRRLLDRRKDRIEQAYQQSLAEVFTPSSAKSAALRILAVGLPFYASVQLAGTRLGQLLLVAFATGLIRREGAGSNLAQVAGSRLATLAAVLLLTFTDFLGWSSSTLTSNLLLGYLAFAASVVLVPPPLPVFGARPSLSSSSVAPQSLQDSRPGLPRRTSTSLYNAAVSPLISSSDDVNLTLISGLLSLIIGLVASPAFSISVSTSLTHLLYGAPAIAAAVAGVVLIRPIPSILPTTSALVAGSGLVVIFTIFTSPSVWPGTISNLVLVVLTLFGVWYDTILASSAGHSHHHDHSSHNHPTHAHSHGHHSSPAKEGEHSAVTAMILQRCQPGSLIHGIVSEKDSRRIAYFTLLNFAFMIVQGIYGYLSGSLGLLSDTVHMFFDCLGLVVGLGAAVASRWPTSPEKPYGWGKLNTLAGFGNGIFLMLVSVEFVWEAVEGIVEGSELRHVRELLVVSTLGFLVNMVGLFAFGHAHHGHDHGHDHGHSHGHSHGHDHSHGHGHDHNENMHGIFLHVAADAGGSLAVIISTALTLWKPWYLWDPLATILIAVLIFAAAVPLVTASAQKLLLVVPGDQEYSVRDALVGVGELRGVVGVEGTRIWSEEISASVPGHDHDVKQNWCGPDHDHNHAHGHGHSHGHSHGHGHDHDHDHSHDHSHDHGNGHLHEHTHSHDHAHDHDHKHNHNCTHTHDTKHSQEHHDHKHSHSHSHDHSHDHAHSHANPHGHAKSTLLGTIRIIAAPAADLEDVRARAVDFLRERKLDLVVQVEREMSELIGLGNGAGTGSSGGSLSWVGAGARNDSAPPPLPPFPGVGMLATGGGGGVGRRAGSGGGGGR